MFGAFFDTAEVHDFADWVGAELRKTVSAEECQARSKRKDALVQRLNQRVATKASQLAGRHRLNFYKKAKLGTRLEALLDSAGYPKEFAKQFAYEVVALVATADVHRT